MKCSLQILFTASAVFASAAAFAQATNSQQAEGKKVVSQMADACATVMGANYLEQRCLKLDKKLTSQLLENAMECKRKMVAVIGLPEKLLQDMDSAAKATADSQECNDNAKNIATGALDLGSVSRTHFWGLRNN